MSFLLFVLTLACIYAILTLSLNLLVGYAGVPSFAHGIFFGIGSYTVVLGMLKLHLPYLAALILGVLLTGVVAALVGVPALRLGGDYFVVACFAFIFIALRILFNWQGLTNGAYGLYGIARPNLFGLTVGSGWPYLALALIGLLLVLAVIWRLVSSPYGLMLQAIRDDELVAESLGRDVTRAKIVLFAIAGSLTAVAGALFAPFISVIEPNVFGIGLIILLWAMLFIGGSGNLYGPILGALVLVMLPEGLRLLGISGAKAGELQQMIYGMLLVVLMFVRPQGLVGKFRVE
jgi:branched-chain amino acid transport system permease protein